MASLCSFTLPKPTSSFIIKSSTTTTTTATPPAQPAVTVTVESLQERFGRKGIKFTESTNGISFAELTVRNGSSLKLQIPNAHVTSYKPKVYWKDDGFEELLYTLPGGGGAFQSRGGIGLILNDEKGSTPIVNSDWIVDNVDSDAIDALQVELRHLISKRRSGAAIQGLQGCSYCTQPPLSSPFELLSPSEAVKTESPGWFFGPEPPEERSKPFHRTTPSKYEYIDQGRELFFRVIRMGFEDIYLSGPGSYAEKFGKDYFICTGPASMVVPVVVNPGEEWRGAQVIEHDNL